MKNLLWIIFLFPSITFCQIKSGQKDDALKIHHLINQYSEAREKQDTDLLKSILTEDIDQLVSSGEWRNGISEAIQGMQSSSQSNPGTRTLEVEKIKFLSDEIALVDCRYVIQNPNGNKRNMWSSFIVVWKRNEWKIAAIRNMNPTNPSN
mgnify:CR=1 FL=1